MHGSGTIPGTWNTDLDRGFLKAEHGDATFDISKTDRCFLEPDAPSKMRKMGATTPSCASCASATLRLKSINVHNLPPGTDVCVNTGGGRFARLRINLIHDFPGRVDVTFVTWKL